MNQTEPVSASTLDSLSLTAQPQDKQAASQPATQPASRPAYTAPSPAFGQLGLAAGLISFAAFPEFTGAGREVSESVSFSPQGVTGRSGITAPPTVLAASVVGRSGLQRGQATGLGFASPVNNLFRASANPVSGPTGRCGDLARAGFFGGNAAACAANFRR